MPRKEIAQTTEDKQPSENRKLNWMLSAIFLFALIMGPGLYLINEFAAAGGTFIGVPALYAWASPWLYHASRFGGRLAMAVPVCCAR